MYKNDHHSAALISKIERLERENEGLKDENKRLNARIDSYEETLAKMEKIKSDYFSNVEQTKELRDKYQDIIDDAQAMKNKYEKEVYRLIKQLSKVVSDVRT